MRRSLALPTGLSLLKAVKPSRLENTVERSVAPLTRNTKSARSSIAHAQTLLLFKRASVQRS